MSRQQTKICPVCKQLFRGRRDAVTCSSRCRKRLYRAKLAESHEPNGLIHSLESAIESGEKAVENIERKVVEEFSPTIATEEGYVATPTLTNPTIPGALNPTIPVNPSQLSTIPSPAQPVAPVEPATPITPSAPPLANNVPPVVSAQPAVEASPLNASAPPLNSYLQEEPANQAASSVQPTVEAVSPITPVVEESPVAPTTVTQATPVVDAAAPDLPPPNLDSVSHSAGDTFNPGTSSAVPTQALPAEESLASSPVSGTPLSQVLTSTAAPVAETPVSPIQQNLPDTAQKPTRNYFGSIRQVFTGNTSMLLKAAALAAVISVGYFGISSLFRPSHPVSPVSSSAANQASVSTFPTSDQATSIKFNRNSIISGGHSLLATGPVLFKNDVNSDNAFNLQDASGSTLINANTITGKVTIKGLEVNGPISSTGNLTSSGSIQVGSGTSLNPNSLVINSVTVCTSDGCSFNLPLTLTNQGNSFNGPNELLQLNGQGQIDDNLLGANVALLSGNQTFTGDNTFTGKVLFQNAVNGNSNFSIQRADGTGDLFVVDTTAGKIGIGRDPLASLNAILQVNGSIDLTGQITFNGNQIDTFNLSDSSNIARLNSNQTFTGNNTFISNLSALNLQPAGSTLTIGATTAALSLQGNMGSQLIASNGTFSTTIGFNGTPTGDVTYNFDAAASPGTYTICTTVGNCVGSGGAVATPGGTANHLAKFTGSETIADSSILDNGLIVSVGLPTAFRASSNSTTAFRVQNSSGLIDLIVADTTDSRVGISLNTGNVPQYPLDVAGDINSSSGLRVGGNLVCTSSGCSAVQGSGFFISNGTTLQTNANFNIQSAAIGSVVAAVQGISGQTANLLNARDGNGTLVFSITNTGSVLLQPSINSQSAFVVQSASPGNNKVLAVDTSNSRVAINQATAGYTLDVNGDVNISTGSFYRINGTSICGPQATCAPSAGSAFYIQNGTTLQTGANFFISSANINNAAGILRGALGQLADILDVQNGTGNNIFTVGPTGNILAQASTNSTTAFQVQDASGSANLLIANTINNRIGIGTNAPGATLTIKDNGSGSGVTTASLTASGNEITDATRTTNTQGDGATSPDSSFGIWESTTNLVTNGGFESNTTGWAGGQGAETLSRDTTTSKFGSASLKTVTDGSHTAQGPSISPNTIAVTSSTTYSMSVWAKADQTVTATLRFEGNSTGTGATAITLTTQWQRFTSTFSSSTNTLGAIRIFKTGASDSVASTIWVDGVQLEQKPTATPYVETNGSTASRSAARVQASTSLLGATQSWVAMRINYGFPSTTTRSGSAQRNMAFFWGDANNGFISLYLDTDNTWVARRQDNLGNADLFRSSTQTFNTGDSITLVMAWDSGHVYLSINGASFSSAVSNHFPVSPSSFDIGTQLGTQQWINSKVMWAAGGTGVLTNTDASTLNSLGNTDPTISSLSNSIAAGSPTMAWAASSVAYQSQTGVASTPTALSIQDSGGNNLLTVNANSSAGNLIVVGTNTTTASGGITFGNDTNLYRASAGSLIISGGVSNSGRLQAAAAVTTDAVGSNLLIAGGAGTGTGNGGNINLQIAKPSVSAPNFTFASLGNVSVTGIAVDNNYIYYATGSGSVFRANLDGSSPTAFIGGGTSVRGVAVDSGHIYWTDTHNTGTGTIGRANLDGTGVNQSFITTGGNIGGGIAIDSSYIYWAGATNVGRANIDGTGVNISFASSGGATPTGVAVDSNFIYVENVNSQNMVRINLDGTGGTTLFSAGSGNGSVAVDSTFVYWGSSTNLFRTNLNGTNSTVYVSGNTQNVNAIALDGANLYWNNRISTTGYIARYAFGNSPNAFSTVATISGANGAATFQNATDSTNAFQIQNNAGTSNLLVADTSDTRLGIGTNSPLATLSVNGTGLVRGTSSSPNTLTVSGNEITDASRAQNIQGDGRTNDSSYGIWEATTNLITNGGFESNTTGWSVSSANAIIARDTSTYKFGSASLKVTSTDTQSGVRNNGLSATSGTVYTESAWVNAPAGTPLVMQWVRADFSTVVNSTSVTATGSWQRITVTATAPATETEYFFIKLNTGNAGTSFWTDGAQVEQKAYATPYVETNGATASRSAGRLQVPIAQTNLNATQGWFATRYRYGFSSTNTTAGSGFPWVFDWRNDINNRISIAMQASNQTWVILRAAGGSQTQATSAAQTFNTGDSVTIVAYWTATTLAISINGGSFVVASNTLIPSMTATSFDIGENSSTATQVADSDIFWTAAGTGTLTNADATSINNFGSTDPFVTSFSQLTYPSFIWHGNTASYQTSTSLAFQAQNSSGNNLFAINSASSGLLINTNSNVVQNSTDSTNAFAIQNAAGNSNLFIADTADTRLGVATATPLATFNVSGTGLFQGTSNTSNGLTVSGNEITDNSRAVGQQGDGRTSPDSSYGIWESTTNLVTNGGFESNTTGWVKDGSTLTSIARDTSTSKFGAASLKVITGAQNANEGANFTGGSSLTGSTAYTYSTWLKGSGSVQLYFSDGVGATTSSPITLTSTWTRYSVTRTTASSPTDHRFEVFTAGTSAITFWEDGTQVEQKSVVTPYVETNGATASRTTARVQAPSNVINTTQGWIAFRVRMGYASTDTTSRYLFVYGDDSNNHIRIDTGGGSGFEFVRKKTGGTDFVQPSSQTWAAGDLKTIVARWNATTISISIDGSTFSSVSSSNIPNPTTTMMDIGNEGATGSRFDGDILWTAAGTGTLTNTDASAMNNFGNTDPYVTNFSQATYPTFVWHANNATYQTGTNLALQVQNSSGNNLLAVDSANAAIRIGASTNFQNLTDSTNALTVANAAGTQLFNVNTSNLQVSVANLQSSGSVNIVNSLGSISLAPGISSPNVLTLSGNEITDAQRAIGASATNFAGQSYDGRTNDSSMGIWESTTNLVKNGGAESNTNQTTQGGTGNTITRDATVAKFGTASFKDVTDGLSSGQTTVWWDTAGANSHIVVSPSTSYTASGWVKGNAGGEALKIAITWFDNTGTVTGSDSVTNFTATTSFARYTVTGTSPSNAAQAVVRIGTSGTSAVTFWADGVQLEQKAYATPYVETVSSSQTRSASIITAPAALLNASQGWFATRVRMSFASSQNSTLSTQQGANPRIMEFGTSTDRIAIAIPSSSDQLQIFRTISGVQTAASVSVSWSAGDIVTIVGSWTSTTINLSVNGSSFVSAAAGVSSFSVSTFSIGNRASGGAALDSDILWAATGIGTLTNADASIFNGFDSNTDPTYARLNSLNGGNASPTFAWNGITSAYNDSTSSNGQALIYAANTSATLTGNLIDLQSGTSPSSKFNVDTSGNAIIAGTLTLGGSAIKPVSDSTTAIQIQNSLGSALFTVDTTNSQITLGPAGATPVALIVGTKNTSGDPASGTNGEIYYNSVMGAFRCYQAGVWVNCTGSGGGGGGGGDVNQGGNSFGTAMAIGTNDNNTLSLRTNAVNVLTLGTNGSALFQNSANSTTAFQVQNLAGTSNSLVVDTTNNRVGIGAAPANSTLTVGTNTTTSSGGITFGTDTSLFRAGNGTLAIQGSGASTLLTAPVTGTDTAGNNLVLAGGQGTGTGNGGNINLQIAKPGSTGSSANSLATVASLSGVNGAATFKNATNSTTAFQVQNAAGTNVLAVDTTNGKISLGTAGTGGIDGAVVLNSTNASNYAVTLAVSNSQAASYTLKLPTTAPTQSQCLQIDGTDANQLDFVTCAGGGGAVTLQDAYNSSSSPATIATTSTSKGIIFKAGTSNDSTTLFQVQNAAGTTFFDADSSNSRVGIGTTSALATLQVSGTGLITGASASPNTLTVSGNEITDAVRAQNYYGDGRVTDSSYGIWESTTNLVLNGGVESNLSNIGTLGASGVTLSRDTTTSKFGSTSAKIVTDGTVTDQGMAFNSATGLAATTGTTYTGSIWVKGTPGAQIRVYTRITNTDASVTDSASTTVTLTSSFQRVTPASVSVASSKTGDSVGVHVRSLLSTALAYTAWGDGAQVEQKSYSTPYVETNGGTASRSAAQIQTPLNGLTPTQGWVSARIRVGFSNADSSGRRIFSWGDNDNNRVDFYILSGSLVGDRYSGGSNAAASVSLGSFSAGTVFTVSFAWTSSQVKVSFNGASFTTTSNALIPTLSATNFYWGVYRDGTQGVVDSDLLWAATGTGTLTNTDASNINAFGNADPYVTSFAQATSATMVWHANNATYQTGTNLAFQVQNSSGANLLNINSANTALVANTNTNIFQNTADNTNAFAIQNAAGNSNLFVADTQDSRLGIGTATPVATANVVGSTLIQQGSATNLTVSGNEITDANRATNTFGDGRAAPDSSYGIWEGTTNLVPNGGAESTFNGFLNNQHLNVARTNNVAKFGIGAFQATTNTTGQWSAEWRQTDNSTLIAASAGNTYTFSLWSEAAANYGTRGATINIVWCSAAPCSGGTAISTSAASITNQSTSWTRYSVTATAPATTTAVRLTFTSDNSPGTSETYYFDGVQFEQKPFATPYVETSTATASRSAARVQAPASALNITQGWAAFRVRAGEASTAITGSNRLLEWDTDSNNKLYFGDVTGGGTNWKIGRLSGGTDSAASVSASYNAGDLITLVVAWTSTQVSISVNGSAFTTAANTLIPNMSSTSTFDIGSSVGTSLHWDGDILWTATGTGTLTNTDAANLNNFGSTDPSFNQLPANSIPTLLWKANTVAYSTSSSADIAFQVNNNIGSSLLSLDATNSRLTVNTSGLFQNATNSATAFTVNTSGGTQLFNVNTSNLQVTANNLQSSGVVNLTNSNGTVSLGGSLQNVSQTLTTSGNEITDASRTTNTSGDGRTPPDSSYGIWETTTNQVINGGFETNSSSWSKASVGQTETFTRDTTNFKFGTASLKVVTDAAQIEGVDISSPSGLSACGNGSTCTFSAWVWVPTGMTLNVRVKDSTFAVVGSNQAISGSNSWVRAITTITGTANTATTTNFYFETSQAGTLWVDGVQEEQKAFATPYVETNGGTATRNAARVQAPATNLSATQGWVAVRGRFGFASAQAAGQRTFWFGDGTSSSINRMAGTFQPTSLQLNENANGGPTETSSITIPSWSVGDTFTVIFAWTSNSMSLSYNGGAFTTTSRTQVPVGLTTFDIGSIVGNNSQLDGDMFWMATGTGTLSNTDATNLNAQGNTDPTLAKLYSLNSGAGQSTFVWNANTANYQDITGSNGDALIYAANPTGTTGNLIDLQSGAFPSSRFSVDVTGRTLVQTSTNSTTAFQIQNSAGTSNLLVADTANTRIGIGTATPTATLAVNGTGLFQASSASNPTLTLSGNEITDASRTTNTSGDGRTPPDSSEGIWESTTNVVQNGGFESNTTTWAGISTSETLSRDTSKAKFGSASLKVITPGSVNNEGAYQTNAVTNGTGGQTYTFSAWVWAATGATLQLRAATGGIGTIGTTSFTGNNAWQRVIFTGVLGGSGAQTASIQIWTNGTQATTFWVDGAQVEQKAIATPYVETNGGTASRSAARVQVPATTLNSTQGWMAARIRWGGGSTSPLPTLMDWETDSTHKYQLYYNISGGLWTFERNNGAQFFASQSQSLTSGQLVTVIVTWGVNSHSLSINGNNFISATDSGAPSTLPSTFEIGEQTGTTNFIDSDILWSATGTGTLTNTDAATINGLGSTDPGFSSFPGASTPTMVWQANTSTYINSSTTSPLVFNVENSSGASLFNIDSNLGTVNLQGATTAASSLMFGNDTTANLYRSSTGTIATSGSISVGTNLAVTGTTTLTGNLTANGSSLFKNTTNSTTAFQIQNASSTNLLTVDTTNNKIGVGANPTTATTSATFQVSGNASVQQAAASALTVSGNEITDATRTTNTSGDGRATPDSSYGIWEATTNLVTNGGMETNATGWTTGGTNTVARDTGKFKFGTASLKATYQNNIQLALFNNITVTNGQTYTASAWVYVPLSYNGTQPQLEIGSGTVAIPLGTRNAWQRVSVTFTASGTSVNLGVIERGTVPTAGQSIYLDGAQVENKPFATPYVETNGGTATRSAARVQAPASVLNGTQFWYAFRIRYGFASSASFGQPVLFNWITDSNNRYSVELNNSVGWQAVRRVSGSAQSASLGSPPSFSAGDTATVVVKFDSTGEYVSVNGSSFAFTADARALSPSGSLFDIGQTGGVSNFADSDTLWTATGTGTLTNSDATAINNLANADPDYTFFTAQNSSSAPTLVWKANNANYQDKLAFSVQSSTSANVFGVDMADSSVLLSNATSSASALVLGRDANLYRSGAGILKTDGNLTVGTNLTVNGSTLFQNATDSTTAFQINNAAGSAVVGVDTLHSSVAIGTTPTSTDALTIRGSGSTSSSIHLQRSDNGANALKIFVSPQANIVAESVPLFIDAGGNNSVQIGNDSGSGHSTTAPTLIVQGVASQSADLLDLQNSSGSTLAFFSATGELRAAGLRPDVGGSVGLWATTGNLALNPTNSTEALTITQPGTPSNAIRVVRGANTDFIVNSSGQVGIGTSTLSSTFTVAGTAKFQNASDSTSAVQIQNAAGTSNLLIADTTNTRLAVAQASAAYTLDVGGDINSTGLLRINGAQISTASLSDGSNIGLLNAGNTFTGANLFKNSSNSTTAFQIQNSTGGQLFVADTTNMRLYVGNPSGDTTNGTILVLDNISNGGDPAGVNGAMYYNSTSGKFRCYQAGNWTDCLYASQIASTSGSQNVTATSYGDITGLGFGVVATKNYILQCTLLVSVTGNGGNISMTGPTSPTAYTATFQKTSDQSAGDTFTTSSTYDDGNSSTAFKVVTSTTGTNQFILNYNAVLNNGSNAGTWQLRAKAVDGSSSITFYPTSTCNLRPF